MVDPLFLLVGFFLFYRLLLLVIVFSFPLREDPFNISFSSGLVLMNSFSFCLSEKLFLSPSLLNYILARWRILVCRVFPFSTLNISCQSLLAYKLSAEKSDDILIMVSFLHDSLFFFCWL